jgi:hypothetical protein
MSCGVHVSEALNSILIYLSKVYVVGAFKFSISAAATFLFNKLFNRLLYILHYVSSIAYTHPPAYNTHMYVSMNIVVAKW